MRLSRLVRALADGPSAWRPALSNAEMQSRPAGPARDPARKPPDARLSPRTVAGLRVTWRSTRRRVRRLFPRATQERIVAAARSIRRPSNTWAFAQAPAQPHRRGAGARKAKATTTLVLRGIEDRLLQEGYLYFRREPSPSARSPRTNTKPAVDRAVEGLIAVDTPCRRDAAGAGRRRVGPPQDRGVTNVSSITIARGPLR